MNLHTNTDVPGERVITTPLNLGGYGRNEWNPNNYLHVFRFQPCQAKLNDVRLNRKYEIQYSDLQTGSKYISAYRQDRNWISTLSRHFHVWLFGGDKTLLGGGWQRKFILKFLDRSCWLEIDHSVYLFLEQNLYLMYYGHNSFLHFLYFSVVEGHVIPPIAYDNLRWEAALNEPKTNSMRMNGSTASHHLTHRHSQTYKQTYK